MIQANELRIGNWVGIQETALHADGCNYLEAIFQIKELKKDVAQFKGFHTEEYYKDLKGIPLTEEWLVRLGFKKISPHGSIWKLGNFHVQDFIQLGIYECNNHVKIKYIHQLQNLYFALTGEELKLNDK